MPMIATFGAGSARSFGFGSGGDSYYSATGGTITTDGIYTLHTFTSSGTFTVTEVGTIPLEYTVVAGGGGCGMASAGAATGGGGGGGGFRTTTGTSGGGSSAEAKLTLATGNYTVMIGAGGAAGTDEGASGGDSVFGPITSLGGGGGGGNSATSEPGLSGGCGGGGAESNGVGGAGTAGQGFAGGTGSEASNHGGGGGGAGAVGTTGASVGLGGAGLTNALVVGEKSEGGFATSSATGWAGDRPPNSGTGGRGNVSTVYAGGSGIVAVRYITG